MLKLIIAFERRPGLSRADSHKHLEQTHASLLFGTHEFKRHVAGYVQNFADGYSAPCGSLQFVADGIVELWFKSLQTLQVAFSEPRYLEVLRPDEMRFADLSRLICAATEERLIWDQGEAGSRKIIRLVAAHPGQNLESAEAFWKHEYPKRIRPAGRGRSRIRRYVQSWPAAGAQGILPSLLPLFCVEEFWFGDETSEAEILTFEKALEDENDEFADVVNVHSNVLFIGYEKHVIAPVLIV